VAFLLGRRLLIFPIGSALVVGVVVVAGAAGAAGVVAAAHLQLQRRRQIHSLALKISCKKEFKIHFGWKKLKTHLGVVFIVVVVVVIVVVVGVGVGVFFVQGGADLARVGLSLLDGAQMELLTLVFKGDVLNCPHGGALGHCEQRHANKRSGENHSWSCSDVQLMLFQSWQRFLYANQRRGFGGVWFISFLFAKIFAGWSHFAILNFMPLSAFNSNNKFCCYSITQHHFALYK
jgi:hypothetical protein